MNISPPSSNEEKVDKKISPTSKRFITRKIEEMFQNEPEEKSSFPNKPVTSDNLLEKVNDRDNSPFFLKYPFLILLGLMVAVGWLIFFLQYYQKQPPTISIQIEKFAEWQHNAPIIATPIISDIDGDGKPDIGYGDRLGYLWAVNPRTKETIYQTFLGGSIIASLATLEVDGKAPQEIFATTEEGKFFTINRQGGYLYPSREEYFSEHIYTKPVILHGSKIFYLAGMGGRVWGVGSDYGEVLWMNDNSIMAQDEEGIFSSPVLLSLLPNKSSLHLVKKTDLPTLAETLALVVAGEKGTVATFNLASGGLRWQKKLKDSFKATPLVISDHRYLLLAGVMGGVWLLNHEGNLIDYIKLNETFISSPATGKFLGGKSNQVFLIAESGNGFLIFWNENSLQIEQVISIKEKFISSPIIVDWNGDGRDDILSISREGGLYLWTINPEISPGNKKRAHALTPLYRIGHKVTATPVIGDLNQDGQVEVVIAGENGKLSVVTFRTTPPIFSPGEILSSQFLKNSIHDR